MTGNQNFEGSMSDALARLGLGVPQVSIHDDLFIFWSNRTCELPCNWHAGWPVGLRAQLVHKLVHQLWCELPACM